MNKYNLMAVVLISVLSTGCNRTTGNTRIAYLAVDMPKGPIYTKEFTERKDISSSRVSPGIYRPPANVMGMLKDASNESSSKILRDVDVIMTTPGCVFPIICFGFDEVRLGY